MNIFRVLLLVPFITALPVMAQPASVVRDTELKTEPYSDAKAVMVLKARQQVDVGERQGGWYKAKSRDGKSGWLRLTSILFDAAQGRGDSGVAATQRLLQSGRSGTTGVTAATGIRGLDSADVVNAKPNPGAVTGLDALAADSTQSRRFAAEAHLSAKSIGYLPAEEK